MAFLLLPAGTVWMPFPDGINPLLNVAIADEGDDDGDDAGDDDGDDAGDDEGDDADDEGGDGDDTGDDVGEGDDDEISASPASGGGTTGVTTPSGDEPPGGDIFVENEIVAVSVPNLSQQEADALTLAGFSLIEENSLRGIGATVSRFSVPEGSDIQTALSRAQPLAPNALFDFNHLYAASGRPCAADVCWEKDLVRLKNLPSNACRRGAPIAIIDTVLDADHPALKSSNIDVRNFLSTGVKPAASDHGTAIAALLVGQGGVDRAPLAPGARLLAAGTFRLYKGRSKADAVAILRGLDWAIIQKARVIAMSIEGPPNKFIEQAIKKGAKFASIVAAAGNNGPRAKPAYPAAYPEVIAVAAVDRRLRPYRHGNRGRYVEIAAPGVGITSVDLDGTDTIWSGSSFAVPFVVGALLRARAETKGNPGLARRKLMRGAKDLGAPGRDEIYGHGLLQTSGSRCQ